MIVMIYPVYLDDGKYNDLISTVNSNIAKNLYKIDEIHALVICATQKLAKNVSSKLIKEDLTASVVNADLGEKFSVGSWLNFAKDFILEDDYVVFCNLCGVLPDLAINSLYETYLEKPHAGLIECNFTGFDIKTWKQDIYSENSKVEFFSDRKVSNGLIEVDYCHGYGVMTKAKLFLQYNFEKSGVADYGIWLRKQGYINYMNTNIKTKYMI